MAGFPCGCFLWHNTNRSFLVDYNCSAKANCVVHTNTQLVCGSPSQPSNPVAMTKAPTSAATSTGPNPTSGEYVLLEKGVGSSCPSGMEAVPKQECIEAAQVKE